MTVFTRRALLVTLIAASLTGCGKDESANDNPLAYVPADTPYVMANSVTTPKSVIDAWLNMYGVSMEEMYADLAKNPEVTKIEGDFGDWLRAALPEIGKLTSVNGMDQLGLKSSGRYAMYGFGLMPVSRIEVSDPALIAKAVARIEERAGKKLSTRKLGNVELWQFADEKAQVLFGVVGKYLVVTLAPAKADDARLSAQIGLTLPQSSLASSGALSKLDKDNGYDGHLSGYLDIRALAQRLSGRNQEDNQVIAAFGGEVPKLNDACATELDSMTQKFPRMVFGTTRLDEKIMSVNSIFEVEPGLAKSMQKLAAPIPGGASKEEMMLRFAVSVDLPETIRFLSGIADAISASPYQCEELKEINNSAGEMKTNLANPGLAMAGAVNAIHVGVQSFKMEKGAEMPSELSAFVTLGASSPLMLWGLAQQSVPALAQMQLTTDGKIVALPTEALPVPIPLQFKALMTDKSLGVATSDIADHTFTAAATVPAQADGTMLRYSFSGAFFQMIADNIPTPAGAEMDAATAKELERSKAMMRGMGEHIDQMEVRMMMTARGIEFVQESSLK